MCFSLPVKVVCVKAKKIEVELEGEKKKVLGSLVKVKTGDWVFLRNNFIVGKINQKEAKEILNLIKQKEE
jgi:hydrogenase maturation factor